MPTYNSSKTISRAINSVIKQSYKNWELLITDDCSNDNTIDIINNFIQFDNRIKLFKNIVNSGSAFSRNISLNSTNGRYITFLDSDDEWDNNFLCDQIDFMNINNYYFVFSSYRRFDINKNKYIKPFIVPQKVNYHSICKSCSISCLTAIYDTNFISKVFFKDEQGSLRDDHNMWLNILKKYNYAFGNSKILATYYISNNSITSNKLKLIIPQFMVYFKFQNLNFFKSIYYTICWAFNGIFKYKF
jgi:glycosyltransferase involved in cell wall biosynthesis